MTSVLVTGASGNLGKSVVTTLHEAGFRVLATLGSNREFGVFDHLVHVKTDIVSALETEIVHQYLTENAAFSIKAAVLLIGGFAKGAIEDTDVATLDKMYHLNFISAFNFVKPLLAQFEAQGGGQFVFIGARPPIEIELSHDVFAYTMSKTLLFKLADYVNEYGKGKNIKATMLVPSTIDTPQTRHAALPNTDFSQWVTPDFIAQKIVDLVSNTEGSHSEDRILKLYNKS